MAFTAFALRFPAGLGGQVFTGRTWGAAAMAAYQTGGALATALEPILTTPRDGTLGSGNPNEGPGYPQPYPRSLDPWAPDAFWPWWWVPHPYWDDAALYALGVELGFIKDGGFVLLEDWAIAEGGAIYEGWAEIGAHYNARTSKPGVIIGGSIYYWDSARMPNLGVTWELHGPDGHTGQYVYA